MINLTLRTFASKQTRSELSRSNKGNSVRIEVKMTSLDIRILKIIMAKTASQIEFKLLLLLGTESPPRMVGWLQGCSPGELAVISRKRKGQKRNISKKKYYNSDYSWSNRLPHLDVVLFLLLVISFLLAAGLGGKWTVRCISLFNYLNAAELQNQPPVVLRV